MAEYTNVTYLPGLLAGASLAAKQYHAVKFATTAGEVVSVAATTDVILGLIQNDPADGEEAKIASGGVAIGVAGTSTISAGNALGANTTGQLVNTTTDNRPIVGLALEASSNASGDLINVLVQPARY